MDLKTLKFYKVIVLEGAIFPNAVTKGLMEPVDNLSARELKF